MALNGRHIVIRGVVQGVGFRPWVYQVASSHGVNGAVRNDSTGVVIEAFGDDGSLDGFARELERNPPPAARVREIVARTIPYRSVDGFTIARSETSEARRVTIPPELATCDDCLRELFDPHDRRYLYPFINCTNCGPRYSIVRDMPYDREKTTMAPFTMCWACRREYEDPRNRRFHAQPNACPKCGPRVLALTPEGREIRTADAIRFAATAVKSQLIVAVKGLGGFHLACDATSDLAVLRLRERKRREAKPLAVMVRDLEEAEAIADLSDAERRVLVSVERPIVLATQRLSSGIARLVTEDNPLIGIFLPYTPLHHVLLRECGAPVVMTSGNVSDEPMVYRNGDAVEQLGGIADVFLVHDRDIESRVDDSVVRVIDGAPTLFRRARGYVPRGIEVACEFEEPVLACGAHLKNTFCIGIGNSAFLGPHIGDLETLETMQSYEHAIEKMKRFVGADPKLLAHDLHPEYFSTRYALAQSGVRTIAVQHHHAHVAAVMAEHHLDGKVVGVAYDGTGYGTDGTAWGGEILVAAYEGYERFATFRGIPLAGGDQAIRQVWRIALALLDDAYDGRPPLNAIPLFRAIPRRVIESVRRMIATGLNAPLGRGVGRYFDALGAIGLSVPESRYEGEAAFRWNVAADDEERGRYEVVVRDGVSPREIDLRPLVRNAIDDLVAGVSPAVISARFHNTLAEVTVELARAASTAAGNAPIVLGGGCFQNSRLAADVMKPLRARNRVYIPRDVPPGDGGLALGQALVAAAIARRAPAEAQQTLEAPVCV